MLARSTYHCIVYAESLRLL